MTAQASLRRVFPGGVRPLGSAAALVGVLFGLFLGLGPIPEALVADRAAILDGELWRLFTGHLVHVDGRHLLLNVLAAVVIAPLVGSGRDLLAAVLAGSLAVGVGVLVLAPGVGAYCGFSGVLNTLIVVALVAEARCADHWAPALLALAVPGKILYEMLYAPILPSAAWPSLPLAHALGFLAGLGLVFLGRSRKPALTILD